MDCLQAHYNITRVPDEPLMLEAPLRPLWLRLGARGRVLVRGGQAYVGFENESLLCLDSSGRDVWSFPAQTYALSPVEVVAARKSSRDPESIVRLSPETGVVLNEIPIAREVSGLLAEREAAITATTFQLSEYLFRSTVAYVCLRSGQVIWEASATTDYRTGTTDSRFDSDVACDRERVFVGRGTDLVALELETGRELWSSAGGSVGGLHTVPMVAQGCVLSGGLRGVHCVNAEDGRLLWELPAVGWKTVYGGRVYACGREQLVVAEFPHGRVIDTFSIADTALRRWGIEGFSIGTRPVVSETHIFLGDTSGAIYAFERSTGEPIWRERPEGIAGFSGNLPVIAGNRLYFTSFGYGDQPKALYCYC